ncbi:hypothetical protein [Chelativorans sp. AA-79]|uniref:hypothetical protein n=1 Tax=Chelativorans sp. AA-79 TaxID=3028735 RepID=UPI0023F83CAA|nr:hypothetical protein [Chelativorans sp. AA-79]WEX10012.1 hypothetical protein PVE73_03325 [Chelativorans sp. AA-79]
MADFAAVLRKAVEALKDNTPEAREKIYQKARITIEAKLAAVSSPPQVAERQRELLEEAIGQVEADYAPPPASSLEDDFDSLLSDLQALERAAPAIRPTEDEEASSNGDAETQWDRAETPPPEAQHAQDPFDPDDAQSAAGWSTGAGPALHADPVRAPLDEVDWSQTSQPSVEGPEALPPVEERLAGNAPARQRRGGIVRPLVLLLLLLAVGAAGYGGWLYRDEASQLAGFASFDDLIAGRGRDAPRAEQDAPPAEQDGAGAQVAVAGNTQPAETEPTPAPEEQPASEVRQKFTQRLMPDGREVDEGPAGGEPGLGEGTSVAQATQGSGAPVQGSGQTGEASSGSAAGSGTDQEALPVGQKAIFYEERTNASEGYAENGSVVWSLIEESPGENIPPEPAIQAEATIPEKGLQLRMTIRRNTDQSLPASHIVELIFLTPENFQGGGISNVLRMSMKRTEQDTGSPLLGIPAKIADGFFLVALSDSQADQRVNLTLLRRQSWIDIPIVYSSGRRALITMEKGVPGERIFNQAIDAWSRDSSG